MTAKCHVPQIKVTFQRLDRVLGGVAKSPVKNMPSQAGVTKRSSTHSHVNGHTVAELTENFLFYS